MIPRKDIHAASSIHPVKRQSSVTSKGQTTIPAEIRRELNINPGDRVSFSMEAGRVVLDKVVAIDHAWNDGQAAMLNEWHDPDQDVYND
jgi:AbrB family looped-hinge helix DNA binding protein